MDYPKRPRFFANRFTRTMAKVCLANDIGPEAFCLLAVVAMTEDAKGYREPVTFFNEQLMPLIGAKNVKALNRTREKAVAAGWLIYHSGGKGIPGRYFVAIPERHQDWDDAPTDEETTPFTMSISTQEAGEKREASGVISGREVGKEAGEKREASGQHSSYTSSYPKDNLSQERPPTPVPGASVRKPKKPGAESVPIPAALDAPEFIAAWGDWLADRRDRGKTVTARAAVGQLAKLAPLGPAVAVEWIHNAITQGWTGLYAPKDATAKPDIAEQFRDTTGEWLRKNAEAES